MTTIAGIRTPAQVIALALEDAGLASEDARRISEEAAKRLAVALQSISKVGAEVVIHSPREGVIEWGTVAESHKVKG